MRDVKNFIFVVDGHRRPSRMRNTRGRYRVGAKDAREAEKLLRAEIKFGSPVLLCEDTEGRMVNVGGMHSRVAKYKEIIKEI